MSQQEFDSYLALLCRLLRIAPQQREQVAEEFRTHMEDRLEELLAAGLSRDDAIQQAIGEFGDAAGLAAQLLKIQQGRRNRWIMRISVASVLCVTLVGLLCLALLPEHQQLPVIAKAQAQQESEKSGAVSSSDTPEERIEKALSRPSDLDVHNQPLKDVITSIQQMAKVPVILSVKKLEEAAINLETPVTFNVKGISLKSALRLMLGELGLTYVIEDEVVQITTPEDAGSRLHIRVYDCRELLTMPGTKNVAPKAAGNLEAVPNGVPPGTIPGAAGGLAPAPQRRPMMQDNLVQVVTSSVDPDSWDDVGGPGNAIEYKGMLVVLQTSECHAKVEKLLNLMYSAGNLETKVKVSR